MIMISYWLAVVRGRSIHFGHSLGMAPNDLIQVEHDQTAFFMQ